MNDKDDKIWQLLENFPGVEPPSNFNSLFWEKVRQEEARTVKRGLFTFPVPMPRLAYAISSAVLIVGLSVTLYFSEQKQLSNFERAFKNVEEIEMVSHIDVLKDMEVVQNMDFLQDDEVIEHLEDTSTI